MTDLLTVNDVASRLRVTPYTVRQWLRTGKLQGFHLGGDGPWRVTRAALEAFIAAPPAPATPKPRPVTGRFMQQVRRLPREGAHSV